jgi:hypothetical protein
VSLQLRKGKFLYFASGKTEITVRENTLQRVIHKVNHREQADVPNLNSQIQKKHKPHL